jgi:hypothetical protein
MFDDKVKYKGINGRDLVFDPGFQPWLHVRTYGEVVSVPKHLSKVPMPLQEPVGTPSYHSHAPIRFKKLCDVESELEIGDKIYFHFNTITMNNLVKEEGVHPDKTFYFRVRYDSIICAVRGQNHVTSIADTFSSNGSRPIKTTHKSIIPIGSYVLVEPDWETMEDILLPVYSSIKDENGNPIPLPKEKWIQTKVAPGYRDLKGTVRHVGSPLKGDTCEVKEGDQIIFRKNADWLVKIEGVDYFAIRQRHIMGKILQEDKI